MFRKPKWLKVMRTRIAGPLSETKPSNLKLNLDYYSQLQQESGLCKIEFSFDTLPLSLNHMYERGRQKPKKGESYDPTGKQWVYLSKKAHNFRDIVLIGLNEKRLLWHPKGVTAAIIVFESPHWLTQKRQVNEVDADNKVKPLFDAIETHTGTPDELHWQFHVYKVLSKRKKTTVYLYDLGDIIDYYY